MPSAKRTVVFAALVGGQLVAAPAVLFATEVIEEPLIDSSLLFGCLFGLFFGAINLLAMWIVLSPEHGLRRLAEPLAILWALWLGLLIGGRWAAADPTARDAASLLVWLTLEVGVLLPLFALLRWGRGWRIRLQPALRRKARAHQFHLRTLLVWMAAIACLLAAQRLILPRGVWPALLEVGGEMLQSSFNDHLFVIVLVGPPLLGAFLATSLLARIMRSQRGAKRRWIAAVLLVYVVAYIQFLGMYALWAGSFFGPDTVEMLLIVLGLNAGAVSIATLNFSVLRLCGFRLKRIRRRSMRERPKREVEGES